MLGFDLGTTPLYTKIIEPLAYKAKERNQEYEFEYARQINIFSQQFANEFCIDGVINWEKIVQYNSGENKIKVTL